MMNPDAPVMAADSWSQPWQELQRKLAAATVARGVRAVDAHAGRVRLSRASWVMAPAGSWLGRARSESAHGRTPAAK